MRRSEFNAYPHSLNIGADALCDRGQLLHETDLRCEHGAGCVFGEFGGAYVHDHEPIVLSREPLVQGPDQFRGAWIVSTNDYPIGPYDPRRRRLPSETPDSTPRRTRPSRCVPPPPPVPPRVPCPRSLPGPSIWSLRWRSV